MTNTIKGSQFYNSVSLIILVPHSPTMSRYLFYQTFTFTYNLHSSSKSVSIHYGWIFWFILFYFVLLMYVYFSDIHLVIILCIFAYIGIIVIRVCSYV